jgi:hypothetical protein
VRRRKKHRRYKTVSRIDQLGRNHMKRSRVELLPLYRVFPIFHTFKICGVVQVQWVIVLIDGGETHNFIESTLVVKRSIPMMDFEGFDVAVVGGRIMPCTQKIPQLCLALGNYTVTDYFYVVELQDTNVILGSNGLFP